MFDSHKSAAAQIAIWRRQFPEARFTIVQVPNGNKVTWTIVQTNRFTD